MLFKEQDRNSNKQRPSTGAHCSKLLPSPIATLLRTSCGFATHYPLHGTFKAHSVWRARCNNSSDSSNLIQTIRAVVPKLNCIWLWRSEGMIRQCYEQQEDALRFFHFGEIPSRYMRSLSRTTLSAEWEINVLHPALVSTWKFNSSFLRHRWIAHVHAEPMLLLSTEIVVWSGDYFP